MKAMARAALCLGSQAEVKRRLLGVRLSPAIGALLVSPLSPSAFTNCGVGQFFGSAEVEEHGHLGVDDLFGGEIDDLGPGRCRSSRPPASWRLLVIGQGESATG